MWIFKTQRHKEIKFNSGYKGYKRLDSRHKAFRIDNFAAEAPLNPPREDLPCGGGAVLHKVKTLQLWGAAQYFNFSIFQYFNLYIVATQQEGAIFLREKVIIVIYVL